MINYLRAYVDNDNEWLRVPKAKLESMGLLDRISSDSKEHDDYLYLDTNIDAGIFLECLNEDDWDIEEVYHPESIVRNYKAYKGGLS